MTYSGVQRDASTLSTAVQHRLSAHARLPEHSKTHLRAQWVPVGTHMHLTPMRTLRRHDGVMDMCLLLSLRRGGHKEMEEVEQLASVCA